jgi:hypothetical protein
MKKDNKPIYDSVLECVDLLGRAKEKTNNTLKVDFMQALESVGKYDAAKEVGKKGLPTHIIVSSDIYPICLQVMAKYAKVFKNKLIDSKCTVMLVWDGGLMYSSIRI